MPKNSVQLYATLRNDYVEALVDFSLARATTTLLKQGRIVGIATPIRHKAFISDDASDIFDHYLKLSFRSGNKSKDLEIWAQTTCYKGNDTGFPEPNKTYEIRETLVEALTLRRHLLQSKDSFRILHFTFGPSDYTYGWFKDAKKNSFDLSLYSADIEASYDPTIDLIKVLEGAASQEVVYSLLEKEISKVSRLGKFISAFSDKLCEWFSGEMERCKMADLQAELLNAEAARDDVSKTAIQDSKSGGENIKGRTLKAIASGTNEDPLIAATLARVFEGNPFIKKALSVIAEWNAWTKEIRDKASKYEDLRSLLAYLWNNEGEDMLVIRRILARSYSSDAVMYPADVNIRGITEHTFYNKHLSAELENKIVAYLLKKYEQDGVTSPREILDRLASKNSITLIKDALRHDTKNGATIKPSFYYIEEALKPNYAFKSFQEANLPKPLGYHSSFSTASVQPYDNLKVVIDKHSKPKAIIKVKYFRQQEFPRRAKEESYVGITTKYTLEKNKFTPRYTLPLVMFVDMDEKLVPPEFAIRRLVAYGWNVFFKVDQLKKFLAHQ